MCLYCASVLAPDRKLQLLLATGAALLPAMTRHEPELRCPACPQAMSYRSGHHSTSDDSSRYRTSEEMHLWRARDPAARFQRWLTSSGWWDDGREMELRKAARKEVDCWANLTRTPQRLQICI